jgi:hypothetical protein
MAAVGGEGERAGGVVERADPQVANLDVSRPTRTTVLSLVRGPPYKCHYYRYKRALARLCTSAISNRGCAQAENSRNFRDGSA